MRSHLVSVCTLACAHMPFDNMVFLSVCCVADAPSSKRVPETHFKFYPIEFGTGFSIPQNVGLLYLSNYGFCCL